MKKIIIQKNDAGKRLDLFLAEKFPELTRSKIQKIIKNKDITVNDSVETPHQKIRENDVVVIKNFDIVQPETKITKSTTDKKIFQKIKIIEHNEDFVIINKPAGLIVHGDEHIFEKTLVDYLLEKFPTIKNIGDDPTRPGIVHRLDKEASGLMVVALNQKAFEKLKKQFKNRSVKKIYSALVFGKTSKDHDIINFPISRSQKGFKMAANPKTINKEKNTSGKSAISEFEIEKRFINFTLLKVKIKTGRTHQIRVHMSAYGHPLVGDNLYGTRITREKNLKLGIKRIFLVAQELEFKNLQDETKNYKIKLPKELLEILEIVK